MSKQPGAWISALQGRPVDVEPLSELLPRDRAALASSPDIKPLFQRPRPEAYQEALQSEVARARAEAVTQVQEINSRERKTLSDRYTASCNKLETAIVGIERVVASEVVDLALLVARELIQSEMRHDPNLILKTVEDALSQMPHDGTVSVRLHPDDLVAVREGLKAESTVVDWQPDASLSRGDCILDTPTRIIDSSIGARLSSVRDSLVRLLMQEEGKDDHEHQS